MINVKITNDAFPLWPLSRQTPGNSGVWGNYRFFINTDIKECDYWVVYGALKDSEAAYCPPENTILITTEPPSIQGYDEKFINQFNTVVTCHQDLKARHVIINQQGLPWHLGKTYGKGKCFIFSERYDYDYLKRLKSFQKTKEISVISSNKKMTEGHRNRLNFVKALKEHFGDKLDIFGQGVRDIDDKWDAIYDYKYHIVIENSSFAHYWTEKLSDCYLAGAYPIYYGCPNLNEYFSDRAYSLIEINDVQRAIATIEGCMKNYIYEASVELIDSARMLVLDKYSLFPLIAETIENMQPNPNQAKKRVVIHPEKYFRNWTYRITKGFWV